MRLTATIFFVLTASPAFAELRFEETFLEYRAGVEDSSHRAAFKFGNTGSTNVTIKEILTFCGCTSATASQKTFAPGESGTVEAVFEFGDRVGWQSKEVRLRTDDPDQEWISLDFRVHVPEVFKLSPALLVWRQGESVAPKTVEVLLHRDVPLKTLIAESRDESIRAVVEPVEEEKPPKANQAVAPTPEQPAAEPPPYRRYRLTVTPASVDHPVNSRIALVAQDKDKKPLRTTYVAVRVLADGEPAETTEDVAAEATMPANAEPVSAQN